MVLVFAPFGPADVGHGPVAFVVNGTITTAGGAPGPRPAEACEVSMDARSRKRLEMGASALEFSRAHPGSSPGYAAAVSRLEDCLTRAEQGAARQMGGQAEVHGAVQRKNELRRLMQSTHLAHVIEAGRSAGKALPELAQNFVFRPGTSTYTAFRTAARGMVAEAQTHKEVLVQHGLSEEVLDNLVQALDQFDDAVEQGLTGRQTHVGASAEIRSLANEVVQVVRVIDGLNRYRFMNDAEALAAWESASSVPGGGKPAGGAGEVRPAA